MRDSDGLLIRKWAANAPAGLVATAETLGLTRGTGWPAAYGIDTFVQLRGHNQIWREITGFAEDVATHGLLEWSASQDPGYAHPCLVLGSDRLIYRSVQSGGQVQDPTTDTPFLYWRPVLPFEFLAIATAAEIEAGASAEALITPGRLLAALFKASPNARWHALTNRFGLVKRATDAEVAARSGDGYVSAADLPVPQVVVVPNSSTSQRGLIRTATVDEAISGLLSTPAVTPEGLRAAGDARYALIAGLLRLATQAEARAGVDNTAAMSPLRVLDALRDGANFAASTSRKGSVKRATSVEVAGRSGDGYVSAADLPVTQAVNVPNSNTAQRGLIRTATQDEGRAGLASSPAVTPELVLDALRSGASHQGTTGRRGALELADQSEARGGTDTDRVMTPAQTLDALRDGTVYRGTDVRRGALRHATVTEHTQANPPGDVAATPAGVAASVAARTPNASTTQRGIVELATSAETQAGSDAERAVTSAGVLDALRSGASHRGTTSRRGSLELATDAEHTQGNPPDDLAATPAGVRAVRDALLDSPPGALDTLNELAAALGDDANFSATIMGLINARAPINSPVLTGEPLSTTPPAGDDSTRIATTAWLQTFFGTASRREFTTAGVHSYNWEWNTPIGLFALRNGGGTGIPARDSSQDISLGVGDWNSAATDDTTVWFLDAGSIPTAARAYVAATRARDAAKDIVSPFAENWTVVLCDGTTLWFGDSNFGFARAYVAATQVRDAAKDINLGVTGLLYSVTDRTTLWFGDAVGGARAYVAATRARDAAKDISPLQVPFCGFSDLTTLWFGLTTTSPVAVAIAYVAATQARDPAKDFVLGEGIYPAGTSGGETLWVVDGGLIDIARAYIPNLPERVTVGGASYTNDAVISGLSKGDAVAIEVSIGGTVIAAPLF